MINVYLSDNMKQQWKLKSRLADFFQKREKYIIENKYGGNNRPKYYE